MTQDPLTAPLVSSNAMPRRRACGASTRRASCRTPRRPRRRSPGSRGSESSPLASTTSRSSPDHPGRSRGPRQAPGPGSVASANRCKPAADESGVGHPGGSTGLRDVHSGAIRGASAAHPARGLRSVTSRAPDLWLGEGHRTVLPPVRTCSRWSTPGPTTHRRTRSPGGRWRTTRRFPVPPEQAACIVLTGRFTRPGNREARADARARPNGERCGCRLRDQRWLSVTTL